MLPMVLAAVLLGPGSPDDAAISLTSSQPGGVFLTNQPVILQIRGAHDPASVVIRLKPYDGEVRELPHATTAGLLNLGVLPRGYYEVSATEGSEHASIPVVVVAPSRAIGDRIATDAALSWLIPQNAFDTGAELLRRAGFTWVRERLSWSGVEPERGVYHWDQYDASANAEHARSIHIVQVFHDTPPWARADHARNRYPDDLRDAYRFAQEAAKHFKGRVDAWEVWNEADIDGFSPETGDAYAAFLKAVYLGLKAGDPNVLVAQVSFAGPAQQFAEELYRNGTQGYFDVFNYHIYADPLAYEARAQGHFALLDRYRVPACPVWVTEAGIALRAQQGSLSPEDQRKQAEFIPKAYALSLAAGTDRHFFFVFPHYLENGIEFGAIGPDFRPYPGYAALATATDLLGKARYLGRVKLTPHPEGLHAYAFDNGSGVTVVAWTQPPAAPTDMPIPDGARVYNCVGAEEQPVHLRIGSSPVYVVFPPGVRPSVEGSSLSRKTRPRKPAYFASPIVLRVVPLTGNVNKAKERYELPSATGTRIQVELYNFGSRPVRGRVYLQPPRGWRVRPTSVAVAAQSMGRSRAYAILVPPRGYTRETEELRARFVPDPAVPSPPAAPVSLAVATQLSPDVVVYFLPMNYLLKPNLWTDNIAGIGSMTREADSEGNAVFRFVFHQPGDRWAYPTITFKFPMDWSDAQGLELGFSTDVDDPNTRIRVMLVEPGGATWYTQAGYPATKAWQHVIIPFAELEPLGIGPADSNGKLHLNKIAALRVGCNTQRDEVTLRIRHIALVRF